MNRKTNKIVRKGWVLRATDKEGYTFFRYELRGAYNTYEAGRQDDEYNDLIPDLAVYNTKDAALSWKSTFRDQLLKEAANTSPLALTKPILPIKVEVVPYNLTIG